MPIWRAAQHTTGMYCTTVSNKQAHTPCFLPLPHPCVLNKNIQSSGVETCFGRLRRVGSCTRVLLAVTRWLLCSVASTSIGLKNGHSQRGFQIPFMSIFVCLGNCLLVFLVSKTCKEIFEKEDICATVHSSHKLTANNSILQLPTLRRLPKQVFTPKLLSGTHLLDQASRAWPTSCSTPKGYS